MPIIESTPLIIQKYGGTSVANPERMRHIAARLLATQREGHRVVGVVSAISGETNRLIELSEAVCANPFGREMDLLLATGEQASMALVAMAIQELGGQAVSLTGAQAGIITDSSHMLARIKRVEPEIIHRYLDQGKIVIVAGFQGESENGEITTLGRGGSDLSAIALAAALEADRCQILTDVEGVFTCDPRVVPRAQKIEVISHEEMLEMAGSGSKVMQARSVEFAQRYNVRFEVGSSFNTNPGTIVKEETPSMEQVVVRGISIEGNQAKVTVTAVPHYPGCAARIFQTVADLGLNIDVIVQDDPTDGKTNISFTLPEKELVKMGSAMEQTAKSIEAGPLITEAGIAKLSVVGVGMRTHSGVASKLFHSLAQGGINIQMISTSEIKISVIIDQEEMHRAARLVHTAFELDI